MIKVWPDEIKKIVELWDGGLSTADIKRRLNLDITERQLRRIGASHGSWRSRQLARIEQHEAVENS